MRMVGVTAQLNDSQLERRVEMAISTRHVSHTLGCDLHPGRSL